MTNGPGGGLAEVICGFRITMNQIYTCAVSSECAGGCSGLFSHIPFHCELLTRAVPLRELTIMLTSWDSADVCETPLCGSALWCLDVKFSGRHGSGFEAEHDLPKVEG